MHQLKRNNKIFIQEQKIITDIDRIETQIGNTLNANILETLTNELEIKKKQLEDILDTKLNGIIIRSKSQYIEYNEKKSKYFSNLEKKQSEKKKLSLLKIMEIQ